MCMTSIEEALEAKSTHELYRILKKLKQELLLGIGLGSPVDKKRLLQ